MMLPQDIIRQKRDNQPLSTAVIQAYVDGVTNKSISDAQIAAFCMAVVLNGLTEEETAQLTLSMAHSGTVLQWPGLDGPVIDKHSTGGVGDKISLMLAPMAAACGLYVPMIVGRGLGHTGGTRDKLDCIPGFRSDLSIADFQKTVRDTGCAIIGQTSDFAPADGRIYSVRDVTATVESVPLITASILSKKIAAGLQGLVIDLKYGNGAFMADEMQAHALAKSLQDTAALAGLKLTPVLTDMNSVLGHTAGNAVEVMEAIQFLTGERRQRDKLFYMTLLLVGEMLVLGGLAATRQQGGVMAEQSLWSGRAAQVFDQMIAAQGGPVDLTRTYQNHLPVAPIVIDIIADRDGTLIAMDTRGIGNWLVAMKAGRSKVEDRIDPVVGITEMAPLGTVCVAGQTRICQLHLREELPDHMKQKFLALLAIN